jgi:hypothetical protein
MRRANGRTAPATDPEPVRRRAAGVVKRRYTLAARRYPLFAWAGILDQVVVIPTVEEVLATRARGQRLARAFQEERLARLRAEVTQYRAAAARVLPPPQFAAAAAECTERWGERGLEYTVVFWNGAIAAATGETPLAVFERLRAAAP